MNPDERGGVEVDELAAYCGELLAALAAAEQALAQATRENERLREALEKNADTFSDFRMALRVIGHTTSATAARIAEDATRAVIASRPGEGAA